MEACPYDVRCRSMGEIKVKRRLVSSGHSVRAAQCSAIRCVFGALLSLTCADGKDERQLRIETTTDRGHAGHTGVGKLLHGHRFNVLPCKGTKDGFEHLLRSFRRFDPVFSWFFAETVRSQNAAFISYIIFILSYAGISCQGDRINRSAVTCAFSGISGTLRQCFVLERQAGNGSGDGMQKCIFRSFWNAGCHTIIAHSARCTEPAEQQKRISQGQVHLEV